MSSFTRKYNIIISTIFFLFFFIQCCFLPFIYFKLINKFIFWGKDLVSCSAMYHIPKQRGWEGEITDNAEMKEHRHTSIYISTTSHLHIDQHNITSPAQMSVVANKQILCSLGAH